MRAALPIAWVTIAGRTRAILWWSIGFLATSALMIAYFPAIRDNPEFADAIEAMPEEMKAFFSTDTSMIFQFDGYLQLEAFSLTLPAMFAVVAITGGARIASDAERTGIIDIILSAPLSRRRYAAESWLALVAELVVYVLVTWATLIGGAALIEGSVGTLNALFACMAAGLFGLACGAVAAGIALATGRGGVAGGLAAVIALAAYLLSALAELADPLEFTRALNPYWHTIGQEFIIGGGEPVRLLLVFAVATLLVAVGTVRFRARDLGSGS